MENSLTSEIPLQNLTKVTTTSKIDLYVFVTF